MVINLKTFLTSCGLALAIFLIVQISDHFISRIKVAKTRLARISQHGRIFKREINESPSILAQRHLAFRKNIGSHEKFLFSNVIWAFDHLIQTSGLQFSIAQVIVTSAVLVFVSSFGIFFFTTVGIYLAFGISVISVSTSTLGLLNILKQRQVRKFQETFPEALDLIVRSVRAGLPVSESFQVIASEVAEPVRGRFREVANNLAIGMTLERSLVAL